MRSNTTKKNRLKQIKLLKQRWLQFSQKDWNSVISTYLITQLIEKEKNSFRDRIFNPLVTLSMFLFQVTQSDQSCRNAVAYYISTFGLMDDKPCSYSTGSYCKARNRLSESLCKDLR